LAQRQSVQLILHLRSRLHLLVPVHQQLPHVALFQARHPDAREAMLQQQLQQVRCVPPVGLLLAHFLGPDSASIAQPQLETQFGQQPFEPGIMPASFHAHAHRLARQTTVKLLRLGLSPSCQRKEFIPCLRES